MRKNLILSLIPALMVCLTGNASTVLLLEDFESFGERDTTTTAGDQFTITGGWNDRTDFFAVEGPGSDPAGTGSNGADLFDATNTRGFGLRDLDDAGNPGPTNSLTFNVIDTTGFTGQPFTFSFDLASNTSTYNDNGDSIVAEFDLDYDGVTFNVDESYALTGTSHLGDGTTTSTGSSFTNFSYDLTGPVTGNLGLRIVALGMQDGSDQVTWDNVQVTAIPEPSSLFLAVAALAGFLFVRKRR